MTVSFDYKRALSTTNGDYELLSELLVLFRNESGQMLGAVLEALSGGDGHELARAAHSLKGALANLGAKDAAATARELENIGRQGQLEQGEQVFRRLEVDVTAFLVASGKFSEGSEG